MTVENETMKVMKKRCDKCLFSSAKIVSDERKQNILDYCNETGEAFECHEASIAEVKGVCREFFDGSHSLVVRLAKMLESFEFVEIP